MTSVCHQQAWLEFTKKKWDRNHLIEFHSNILIEMTSVCHQQAWLEFTKKTSEQYPTTWCFSK